MTADLLVVVPTRGRPENARRLLDAFVDTGADAVACFALDADDDTFLAYSPLAEHPAKPLMLMRPTHSMAEALNETATLCASPGGWRYIGFMGDDHLPRTPGWDRRMVAELGRLGTGLAYGDDCFQGANLPTAVFLTADIVRALGYMAPPCLRHMYLDNFWLDLGTALDRIAYVPEVVIEHLHPHAGKAAADEGYERVWPLMDADRAAYETYRAESFADDVAKVRALLAEAA